MIEIQYKVTEIVENADVAAMLDAIDSDEKKQLIRTLPVQNG